MVAVVFRPGVAALSGLVIAERIAGALEPEHSDSWTVGLQGEGCTETVLEQSLVAELIVRIIARLARVMEHRH